MTLLSRITGLARDIAFSAWFGSGPVMDAFAVAFKIPNLMRRFFAEGAFSQAFVPVISEYRTHRSHAETRELVGRVAGTLGVALFAVTAVGVVAAPALILIFAPGFGGDDGRFALAVDMLRFTFPYILFVSLTALAGSVLNAHRRFAVAAFTPVLLNVVMIVFAGWVGPHARRAPSSASRPGCSRPASCSSPSSCRSCGGSTCCRGPVLGSATRACGEF